MEEIGFIAESVRIPTSTSSLIILVVNLQEEPSGEPISRELINHVYQQAASDDPKGYLHYSEKQNVSVDMIGLPKAAAVIEGHETHTRTAEVTMDLGKIPGIEKDIASLLKDTVVWVPVTQAVIYGWYDNEMGSYVNIMADKTISVADHM
jgi:glyceraldehyde 3-phosphate dehydrogenase